MKKFTMLVSILCLFAVMGAVAQAATYTNAVGGATFSAAQAGSSYKMVGMVEFDKQVMAADETISVIKIPANSYVAAVAYQTTVASTNAISIGIGDTAGTNQFCAVSAALTNSTLVTGVSAYTAAKGYTAEDKIVVQVSGASGATGKIKVTATVFNLK